VQFLFEKKQKIQDSMGKQDFWLIPYPLAHGTVLATWSSSKITRKMNLTSKIPCGFGQKWEVLDIFGRTIFLKELNVRNKENNHRIWKFICLMSTLKITAPHSNEIITFKDQNSWKLDAIWKSFQLLEVTS
jgi:hypothetical protein